MRQRLTAVYILMTAIITSTVFYYGVDASGKIYRSPTPVSGLAPIRDALGKDFGKITFDEGFKVSSNIAICELLTNYMNPEVYREYVKKFGFLREVVIPFVPNSAGSMAWEYASISFLPDSDRGYQSTLCKWHRLILQF